MTPTTRAILRALAELDARPGSDLMLPAELPEQLGCTERAVRLGLERLDYLGIITWQRKRPGRPARPGYPVRLNVAVEVAA